MALPSNPRRGRLLLVMAAVLWSTSGVVLKSPPLDALPLSFRGPILACYRAVFALIFLLPFVSWKQVRWRPLLVPMAVLFGTMNFLYITSMTRTTAASAIFLQYTSSVWAFVFGWLILKEPIDRGNLIALIFAVCGIGGIVASEWGGPNSIGNLMALGSGLTYAGVILCLRQLRSEDIAWLITLNHLVSVLILLPFVWDQGGVTIDTTQWVLIAVLGALSMAMPYVLFARAVRDVAAQEAGLLLLLEPVLNPLWVWLCSRETNAASVWIGGGLILAGLAVRYLMIPVRRALRPPR